MRVYYNEFDKKKCAALKQLMDDGHISKGDIDDRSITDVRGSDLKRYERCHFFAGIGLWDYALNLARWPKDRRVWTGSCPCQPFSTAGRQEGKADDRHLWPEWERLIKECKPPDIFGEQVASAVSKGWLDDVYQGLEAQGYAVGSAVLPACSVGAPHRRDRLWFVANDASERLQDGRGSSLAQSRQEQESERRSSGALAYSESEQCNAGKFGNNLKEGECNGGQGTTGRGCSHVIDFWGDGEWVNCSDGKKRLIEPRIPLLADGYPGRVGIINSAGDAIVPQVAAGFIECAMEAV